MCCAGKREVFFEANGVPRVVEITDKRAEVNMHAVCICDCSVTAQAMPCWWEGASHVMC